MRTYGKGATVRVMDFHIGVTSINFEVGRTDLDELVRQYQGLPERERFTLTLTRTKRRGLPDRIQVSAP